MGADSDTSLPIVRAMDIDATSQQANPYSGQVIHASIQVDSIEPVGQAVAPLSADASLEPSNEAAEDGVDKEHADNMRMWWNEAIAKNMNLPEGYEQVAVLIIRWADELDELNTKAEVLRQDRAER